MLDQLTTYYYFVKKAEYARRKKDYEELLSDLHKYLDVLSDDYANLLCKYIINLTKNKYKSKSLKELRNFCNSFIY